jgi:protein SCO1
MIAHILARVSRLAVLVLAASIVGACSPEKLAGTDLGATDAPDFTLTDGITGRSVSLSAQRGNVVALSFLYTRCPDVCPLTAARFRAAQDALGQDANRVVFIAVSVDPEGDTPKAAQDFSAAYDLRTNWHYLVGARAQLAPVWASYGILVSDATGNARVGHNDAVYLIDKRGRERVLLHSEDLAGDLVNNLRTLARSGD